MEVLRRTLSKNKPHLRIPGPPGPNDRIDSLLSNSSSSGSNNLLGLARSALENSESKNSETTVIYIPTRMFPNPFQSKRASRPEERVVLKEVVNRLESDSKRDSSFGKIDESLSSKSSSSSSFSFLEGERSTRDQSGGSSFERDPREMQYCSRERGKLPGSPVQGTEHVPPAQNVLQRSRSDSQGSGTDSVEGERSTRDQSSSEYWAMIDARRALATQQHIPSLSTPRNHDLPGTSRAQQTDQSGGCDLLRQISLFRDTVELVPDVTPRNTQDRSQELKAAMEKFLQHRQLLKAQNYQERLFIPMCIQREKRKVKNLFDGEKPEQNWRLCNALRTASKTVIDDIYALIGRCVDLFAEKDNLTKRGQFYEAKTVRGGRSADVCTNRLDDVCAIFGCRRDELPIMAESRGEYLKGPVKISYTNGEVNYEEGADIPTKWIMTGVNGEIRGILLVEKNSVATKISTFFNPYRVVVLAFRRHFTVNSRKFMKTLHTMTGAHVMVLTDSNPEGLRMFFELQLGIMRHVHDYENQQVGTAVWLGVLPTTVNKLVHQNKNFATEPLNRNDRKLINKWKIKLTNTNLLAEIEAFKYKMELDQLVKIPGLIQSIISEQLKNAKFIF